MKTTVNNQHRNSIINYLFFGIAASIFTLSIFFSVYQQDEKVKLYSDMTFIGNSRITKPVSVSAITETHPVNLKEMLSTTAEAPITIEPWMTESYAPSTSLPVALTTYTESAIIMEDWMTDVSSWTIGTASTDFEEEALTIESWMLNTQEWAITSQMSPYTSNEFAEELMHLEAWMFNVESWSTVFNDANYAEAPLEVESWMLNTTNWLASTK